VGEGSEVASQMDDEEGVASGEDDREEEGEEGAGVEE
jgi:hypothetical protein